MPNTLFHLAPPVTTVDGLTAVPIDIQGIDAQLTFDVASQVASVDATIDFVMGGANGCPVFDLRQDIDQAELDGAAIPVTELAHHDFSGGPSAKLRIVESVLTVGSTHTLRLVYTLGTPDAVGAEAIGWSGSRLSFDFWFSDLEPGRYLEMWLPANLIFDQFELDLELRVQGTTIDHVPITNGDVTTLGAQHWRILFPATWTACSPMLVIEAADRIESREGTLALPGGGSIALRTHRSIFVAADLEDVENAVGSFLLDNIANVGPYLHGDRFTTFVWSSGRAMEYAGGTTSNLSAIKHETFHSWFARGVLPGSQNDGWLDEAFTVWNTGASAFAADPLGLGLTVSQLAPRNAFNRDTPNAAYTRGARVFSGIAAEVGVATLRAVMSDLYVQYMGSALTTERLEEELVARTGSTAIVDFFQRYVYGLPDSLAGGGPDLYLRDAPDDPGFDSYTGSRFWDSPDLWIRNDEDGGTEHQNPEYGQDNWFHARVRNRGASTGRHFLVTFNVTQFAGTQFVYPNDYLPSISAAVEFELPPGGSKRVTSRWPRASVPVAGTHTCLLASVYSTSDPPIAGRRVWEHNNLAQKNLTVVDLQPNDTYLLHTQLGSLWNTLGGAYVIELRRPKLYPWIHATLEHHDPGIVERLAREAMTPVGGGRLEPTPGRAVAGSVRFLEATRLALGAIPLRLELAADSAVEWERGAASRPAARRLASKAAGVRAIEGPRGAPQLELLAGPLVHMPLRLRPRETLRVGLRVHVPRDARPGEILEFDLLQRSADGTVWGGVSLRVHVVAPA